MSERERQRTFEAALGALRRRERSEAELRGWLTDRGHGEGWIDDVAAELLELGELDDQRFARAFADDKRDLAGWGPERIAAVLRSRGIAEADVDAVCGDEPREHQLERAIALLRRRSTPVGDDRERSRALGHLTRRGYSYEVAYDAVRAFSEPG